MAKVVTSDYAQMLLNGVDNFTATYFTEVISTVSHDSIGRAIAHIRLSPKVVREKALELIVPSSNGYLAVDDTVMDKASSEQIEVASAQYSGQKHGITTGIGVVTLVYVNPELNKYWILDYRIYDKRSDGKKKTEHVLDMSELHPERAPFTTVLIHAGYTSKKIMQYIVREEKIFYGVMPKSRKVSYPSQEIDETTGKPKIIYKHVGDLNWDSADLQRYGITVCIEDLPNDKPLRLFRMTLNTERNTSLPTMYALRPLRTPKRLAASVGRSSSFIGKSNNSLVWPNAKPGKDENNGIISA
jgi:hypothetical protein